MPMPSTSWLAPVLVALGAACASPPEPAASPLRTGSVIPLQSAATHPLTAMPDIPDAPPELEAVAALVRAGDWQNARTAAERVRDALGENAALDTMLVANVLVGRACLGLEDLKGAANAYRVVSAAWSDPVAARRRLDDLGGLDAERKRRLGRALTAVGEALFFAAEEKRREADKMVVPVFRGPGDKDQLMRFAETKLKPWVDAKRPVLVEAGDAYANVVKLQPATPPRWAIAAAERVGGLWASFVDDFRRAAPIPKEWQSNRELHDAYWDALIKASEPQLDTARDAYQTCLDYGAKFGVEDERVRACGTWLAAHPRP
jgi:hypothetical protein